MELGKKYHITNFGLWKIKKEAERWPAYLKCYSHVHDKGDNASNMLSL